MPRAVHTKMWEHEKKYKGKTFVGSYVWNKTRVGRGAYSNERTFVLTCGSIVKTFGSWEDAKRKGWVKL
jgi:stalled ribosome alternative rescue factor ArfA